MNTLQKLSTPIEIFQFQTKQLRVVGTYEDPWFAVKDICDILGLTSTHNAILNIPEKWKGACKVNTLSGAQDMNIVNEAGMYKMILRSNKHEAAPFQEWTCEQVLPSIRKKGEYVLQEYKTKLEAQQRLLEEKEAETKAQQRLLEEKNNDILIRDAYIQKIEQKFVPKVARKVNTDKVYNVVYIVSSDYHEKLRQYSIGKSEDLQKRLGHYNRSMVHKVIFYKECDTQLQMTVCENMVLHLLREFKLKDQNHDMFQLPEEKDCNFFIDVIQKCYKFLHDFDNQLNNLEQIQDEINSELNEPKIQPIDVNILPERNAYNNAHKDRRKEQRGTLFKCECGLELSMGGKSRHMKSETHKIAMLKKNPLVSEFSEEYLTSLSLNDLRQMCQRMNIKNYSCLTLSQTIDLIKKYRRETNLHQLLEYTDANLSILTANQLREICATYWITPYHRIPKDQLVTSILEFVNGFKRIDLECKNI